MHPLAHERALTELDHARLAGLLARLTATRHVDRAHGAHDLLDSTPVLSNAAIPPDLVTMRSRIVLRADVAQEYALTLVYPAEADPAQGYISVLSPLGLSLLGCRAGQDIEWRGPDQVMHRGTVARILYQPEAAGDYGT